MAQVSLSQRQAQTLSQTQVMSQRQIQSLKILSLSSEDLREKIYEEAEKNPALEIPNMEQTHRTPGDTRVSAKSSKMSEEASDRFLAALEAKADERTSLKEHLLSQFTVLPLSQSELELGKTLIHNLDEKGFHILSPLSLLDKKDPKQTPSLLEHCLSLLQSLDPAGTCTRNTEESLFVQAKQRNAPPLALFLLDGNLTMLDPPLASKVLKKISDYKKTQASLFGARENPYLKDAKLTEEGVEEAVRFIRTLDPFPARDYGTSDTHYIAPDIYVERTDGDGEDLLKGIISHKGHQWTLRLSNQNIPMPYLNREMLSLATKENAEIRKNVAAAKDFIQLLEFRQNTIFAAASIIVKRQAEFFAEGPGHLVPLRQQDVAEALGVHETTISRMANSKYLQCEWGLFALKYFFTGSVSRSAKGSGEEVSRDKVLGEIKEILLQNENASAKKMSDQHIAEALAERGIHIARRTVAKYRSLLSISSSYER